MRGGKASGAGMDAAWGLWGIGWQKDRDMCKYRQRWLVVRRDPNSLPLALASI